MGAEMAAALQASLVSFHQTNLAELQASQRRYADTISFIDARALGGAIAGSLLVSDNSEKYANLSTAARIPTTLDHPNAVVGK